MAEKRAHSATCGRTFIERTFDEIGGVVALVGAERDRARTIRERLDHLQRRQSFGVAGHQREPRIDDQAGAISISPWPMKQSFASMPGPLR